MRGASSVPTVLTCLTVLTCWYLAAAFDLLPSYVLAHPNDVFRSFAQQPSWYGMHFSRTATEALFGAVIASAAGLLFGWCFAYSLRVQRAFTPLLIGSQVFPKEALAPLILIFFGYGMLSKIVVSVLLSFFPVCVATIRGVRSAPHSLVDYGETLGLNKWGVFWRIQIPYSLPSAASSIKVAFTLAVIGAIVGEFIGSDAGLGYVIRSASSSFATEQIYASLVLLGVLGGAFYGFAAWVEHLILRAYPLNGAALDD